MLNNQGPHTIKELGLQSHNNSFCTVALLPTLSHILVHFKEFVENQIK